MSQSAQPPLHLAAQTQAEIMAFVEAFARLNVQVIKKTLGAPAAEAAQAEASMHPDWDDVARLEASGIDPAAVTPEVRAGSRYLHIDVAAAPSGRRAVKLFLGFSGLSEKQRKALFPVLSAQPPRDLQRLPGEVQRLNKWLDDVREGGFDPAAFIAYQRGIGLHGMTQNLTGAIGATGAAIAFIDAIRSLNATAIVDHVGDLPPPTVRSPQEIYDWREGNPNATVKALLLHNRRALVFASSKDANIFTALSNPFTSAADALERFNAVRNNEAARSQVLHEFVVGEVKTATDPANLHERMGLASRETQTELRTKRFLMMAILNREVLEGGVQRRVMNNRDLTRFEYIFNLHHCWGWDGGRTRNPEHWAYFVSNVRNWCGL